MNAYEKGKLEFEMDLEFGCGGVRSGKTSTERFTNFHRHKMNEQMCKEFGTYGTTYKQRAAKYGTLPTAADWNESMVDLENFDYARDVGF